jgi:hypothetical protein
MKQVFVFFLTIFLSNALFSGISYSGNKTLTEVIAEINGFPITCLKDLNELNAVEIVTPSSEGVLYRLETMSIASLGGQRQFHPITFLPFLTEEQKKISCEELITKSPEEISQYAGAGVVAYPDAIVENPTRDLLKYNKDDLSNKNLLGNLVYMALNCKRPKNKDAALRFLGKFEAGVRGVEDNKLLPTASEDRGCCSRMRMAFMRLFGTIKTHES